MGGALVDDPDMGQWSYEYFASGELKSQTDAKGQLTAMTYDKLGRMLTRTDAGVDPDEGDTDSHATSGDTAAENADGAPAEMLIVCGAG